MGTLLSLILPALVPAALDAVKSLFSAAQRKWLGLTVDEEIKLISAEVEKLKALADLDNPYGTPSQWVIDLRASSRYVAAGISILAGIGLGYVALFSNAITSEEMATLLLPMALDLIGIPFAFIFGERLWAGMKGMKR